MPNQIVSVAALSTTRLKAELGARQPIHTVPIGVDFARISAIEPADERIDVVFAGRLLAHKNVDMLVKAIGQLAKGRYPQIRCLVIGEGPERKNLQSLARELALEKQVEFVDFIATEDDLFARMKCAKVFALPSTREGFGICVLEANACGIPVVVVDHQDNAARNLVRDGENGLVCSLEVESLAAALETILAGHDMRPRALAAARQYDWNNIITRIEVGFASSGRRQPRRKGQSRLWTIDGGGSEVHTRQEPGLVGSG